MQPIVTNVAALAVALLYYLWRSHYQRRQRRQCVLHERVAHMLWVMAETIQEPDATCSAP
jgi:hypothetical protein